MTVRSLGRPKYSAAAFSSRLVNGKRMRVELNRVGMWFADPADDDFCAAAPGIAHCGASVGRTGPACFPEAARHGLATFVFAITTPVHPRPDVHDPPLPHAPPLARELVDAL
jgi:hypothetical protein